MKDVYIIILIALTVFFIYDYFFNNDQDLGL
jgi:hypothetical protein